jgi:hypothetical protein
MRTILTIIGFKGILIIFLLLGWVLNIVKLTNTDFEAPYKTEVIRGVSIFVAPMGGIVGYLKIGEEKNEK